MVCYVMVRCFTILYGCEVDLIHLYIMTRDLPPTARCFL
jgi:hypothetical protein